MLERFTKLIDRVKESSDDSLESAGAGFAFPVPEKVRLIDPNDTLATGVQERPEVSKVELLKTMLASLRQAWEQAIEPRLGDVRSKKVDKLKGGTDFFTEADTESEQIIRQAFIDQFGEQALRIFGEEANCYLGNERSRVGVRIDPVDGTESMKFGKPDWGIMAGVYEGAPEQERQVIGAVYFPERHTLIYQIEGVGVFVSDTDTGETQEITAIEPRDRLGDVIVCAWKHSDVKQRGNIAGIEQALADAGARFRSTDSSCVDVLEALTTKGQRAMVIDGDFNQVDFIPHPMLQRLGYRLFLWDGMPVDADDPKLAHQKVVIVPPGKVGDQILEIVRQHVN